MLDNQVSVTAMVTAYARAYHATHDEPKVFDDFLAAKFLTSEEQTFIGHNLAKGLAFFEPESVPACPDEASALSRVMQLQSLPITTSRSRYTEDALLQAIGAGTRQYVILGAGLDTFAFRYPELLKTIDVYEIDQPGTIAFIRQRITQLDWDWQPSLHLVPIDFTREDLAAALKPTPYDPALPTFFSWLGVTYYLPVEAVFATLRTIAGIAPAGSTVVFDYMNIDAFDPAKASATARTVREITRNAGEPMRTGFDPARLGAELEAVGLRLVENLSTADIEERFFRGHTDRYHATAHTEFARAVVK